MRGIYVVGGYPDRERFRKCIDAVDRAGFDFIEIGLPFSEPVADGPVIASAAARVINKGIATHQILSDLKLFRDRRIRKYIMTYSNIILGYGPERFSREMSGILKGIIIADLPNRLHGFFYKRGLKIPIVSFVTPESRTADIKSLKKTKSPFIYFIGIRGITGTSVNLASREIPEIVKKVKRNTGKPVILGFGIKTRQDAVHACRIADGFVVGTAAVRFQPYPAKYQQFLSQIK